MSTANLILAIGYYDTVCLLLHFNYIYLTQQQFPSVQTGVDTTASRTDTTGDVCCYLHRDEP